MGVVTARLVGGPRDGHLDRIHEIPELVAVEWCEGWQRWTLQAVDPGGDRDGRDLYLLNHDDAQAGGDDVTYRWLPEDLDDAVEAWVTQDHFRQLPPATVAGQAAWLLRLQRLHDAL